MNPVLVVAVLSRRRSRVSRAPLGRVRHRDGHRRPRRRHPRADRQTARRPRPPRALARPRALRPRLVDVLPQRPHRRRLRARAACSCSRSRSLPLRVIAFVLAARRRALAHPRLPPLAVRRHRLRGDRVGDGVDRHGSGGAQTKYSSPKRSVPTVILSARRVSVRARKRSQNAQTVAQGHVLRSLRLLTLTPAQPPSLRMTGGITISETEGAGVIHLTSDPWPHPYNPAGPKERGLSSCSVCP